jgi:MFS transporter, SET family, sugar efflux transporter
MFLSGLATSAAAPQIGIFLVTTLGASLPTAGLFYLTSLSAPVAGYLVGVRSDRTGNRFGLYRLCVIAGSAGYLGIAFSSAVWIPFVISAVVLGFAGTAVSQLFAALHDDLAARPSADGDGIVNVVRMALTAGWVVGPTLGAWLAAGAGLRVMLAATAACAGLQLLAVAAQRNRPAVPQSAQERHVDAGVTTPPVPRDVRGSLRPLLIFTALYVLVYAGEPIKFGFLPIYMRDDLRLGAGLSGAVIGIQPLVELLIMPFSMVVARRVGALRLMAVGALFGVVANILFATTGAVAGMFAGQVLMGGVWGIFASLGILTAQRLLPGAVATASAIFLSAPAVSSALGGAVGGLGVATLGLPHVFLLPSALALTAALGLASFGQLPGRSPRARAT